MKIPLSFYFQLTLLMVVLLLVIGGHYYYRGFHRLPPDPNWLVPAARPERGRAMIHAYGCGACHIIPGIREATGRVGPALAGMRDRVYIAGVLPNSPQNLILWIMDPKEVDPRTAMPDLNVGPEDARDIAAFLVLGQ